MVNLKIRIENLKKETGLLTVKDICESTIANIDNINKMYVSYDTKKDIINNLLENFINQLKPVDNKDDVTNRFLVTEQRLFIVNNLGVRKSLDKISESDIMSNPLISINIERLKSALGSPEYMLAENFINVLTPYNWHPVVKESITLVTENINSVKEDFDIQKVMYSLKNSKSVYIYNAINEYVNNYIDNRTTVSKDLLNENLNKFMFDPMVRNLATVIRESDTSNININGDKFAQAYNIYSPVLISEKSELFGIDENFFVKTGNNIERITEETINKIDPKFSQVVKFINSKNVKVTNEGVTVYASNNRKIKIVNDNEGTKFYLNENEISLQGLNKSLSVSSSLRNDDVILQENLNNLVNYIDSIVNVNFAKRISSKLIEGRIIDVFKLDETIYINKKDPHMGTNQFFNNLNAIQTKTLVNEFLSFDISEAFEGMISKEDQEIKIIDETKKVYIETISKLEEKLIQLNNITNTDVTNSNEYNAIIKILEEEIEGLKSEYNYYVAEIYNKTQITKENEQVLESNINLNRDKYISNFVIGERINYYKNGIKEERNITTGLIIGETNGKITVMHQDGSTINMFSDDLYEWLVKTNEAIELKIDGDKIEIDTKKPAKGEEEEEEEETKDKDKKDLPSDTEFESKISESIKPNSNIKYLDKITNNITNGTVINVNRNARNIQIINEFGKNITLYENQIIKEGFSVGDNVDIIDTGDTGDIVSFNNGVFTILTDDGDTIEAHSDEIVLNKDYAGDEIEKVEGTQSQDGISVVLK